MKEESYRLYFFANPHNIPTSKCWYEQGWNLLSEEILMILIAGNEDLSLFEGVSLEHLPNSRRWKLDHLDLGFVVANHVSICFFFPISMSV